jgi:hypothetical protein
MKIRIFALPVFLLLTVLSFGQVKKDSLAIKYANTIKAGDLSEYLHIIASDSMEGRQTGEPGQKKAAKYLADKFREFGVEPGVKDSSGSSYFQKFELVKKEWQEVYLKIKEEKKEFLKDFYAYGDMEFAEEEKAETVFAGYGIDAERYSDYQTNLNVKGKIVIIFSGEPLAKGKSLVTGDSNFSSWANDWKRKVAAAKAKGAKAVFVIVGKSQGEFNERLNQLKEHISKATLGFTYKEKLGSAFFISINLAAEMLGTTSDGLIRHLNTRSPNMVKTNSPQKKFPSHQAGLKSAKISVKCSVKKTMLSTENVLGFIEGTDKKDEIIVLTAHYDHLGKEGGQIYYGADDDGSGTVALLEIAQAFSLAKKEGYGPRRSILIMPVTAEEKGLMGSEFYVDHPVYPLKNTVVDLNIDMIGRLDEAHANNPDYVYIIGSNRLSTQLHRVSEEVNNIYVGTLLDYTYNSFNDPNRFYFRSDHYNFAKNKIPVIFYFNGVHADYHQPTDTVDKILFNKVEKITRLVFFTAWELANREERIKVDVAE